MSGIGLPPISSHVPDFDAEEGRSISSTGDVDYSPLPFYPSEKVSLGESLKNSLLYFLKIVGAILLLLFFAGYIVIKETWPIIIIIIILAIFNVL